MIISDAAVKALQDLGKPSSIEEIYNFIIQNNLYEFNTDVPQHVLRTTIRRETLGVERVDSHTEIRFEEHEEDIYKLHKPNPKKRISVGSKRIHRAKDKEIFIEQLMDTKTGLFREIWRVMLFAASLGYFMGRKEPLGKVDAGKGIDQATFSNHPAWPGISYLFSMVETDSTRGLASSEDDEDLRISIFEEYANGGLQILVEEADGKDLDFKMVLEIIDRIRSSPIANPSVSLDLEI